MSSELGPAKRVRAVDGDGTAGLERDRTATVTRLFHTKYLPLLRLAVLLVDDRETAEDVVQDAFGQLYRRWFSIHDVERAVFYLRAAVANGGRDRLRRRRLARERERSTLADVPSAEVVALARAEHRLMLAELAQLPRRQRQVLVLRYYLDYSEAQIAETLRISVGSVKTHASRGMKWMAARLEAAQ